MAAKIPDFPSKSGPGRTGGTVEKGIYGKGGLAKDSYKGNSGGVYKKQ